MLKGIFSKKIGMSPKLAAANIVVVASAFMWYFVAFKFLSEMSIELFPSPANQVPVEQLEIIGANIAAIAVSAVLGSFAIDRLRKRTPFLSFWTLGGIFLSFTPMFLLSPSLGGLIIVSAILGAYFGFGMPTVMGYFAASTNAENRATMGGFAFLAIGLSFSIVGSLEIGSVLTSIVLAGVRLASLLLFLSLKTTEEPREEFRRISYTSIRTNRSFMLYFIPWIMFNVVDYFTKPFTNHLADTFSTNPQDFIHTFATFESVLIAVFAVLTGFLADKVGRKRLAILGFASLGIGYASLSFFTGITGWYFYTIVDGIAWGILDVIFLFTLWGDLAQGRNSEKFYVFGALPYLFSNFIVVLLDPLMSAAASSALQIFTFASFFLFLAVLPLVYAPETLPERIMKKRELTIYVEKAQEIAEKYY